MYITGQIYKVKKILCYVENKILYQNIPKLSQVRSIQTLQIWTKNG